MSPHHSLFKIAQSSYKASSHNFGVAFLEKFGDQIIASAAEWPDLNHLGVTEVRATEVRAIEVRAKEVRAKEVRATEVRATEVRATEVRATEVRATEVRVREVSLPPHFNC